MKDICKKSPIDKLCTTRKASIEIVMENINPVVTEKNDSDYRQKK